LSILYDGVKYFSWRGNRFAPSQWTLRSQEQPFLGASPVHQGFS